MSSKAPAIPPLDPTPLQSDGRRIAYYYDHDVGNYHFGLGHPMKPHRIRMAHNLVVNYGLTDEVEGEVQMEEEGRRQVNAPLGMAGEEGRWNDTILRGSRGRGMQVYRPPRATKTDMTRFHTNEYIDLLEQVMPETADVLTGNGTRCLTGTDCPAVEGIFEFSSISAGGSIGAAERLNSGAADIAINWAGGLHHAKKSEASGFCYVNDIVLGILELLRFNARVLYIDIDVHHGDGVEEAFYVTDRVMTCSFHMYGNFFPGTGQVQDVGHKKGKGYAVNVPLREGVTDDGFHSIFKPVIQRIMDHYRPGAVVLQGGADSVSGDKLGRLNLSLKGHSQCARFLRSFNVPLMMLGGGGYTTKNVARAWTMETAVAMGRELAQDLPNNQYMEYYGPRYKLEVPASNADDYNTPEYLEDLKRQIFDHLKDLPFAPSAQMSLVPSQSVSREIGMKEWDAEDDQDDIDQRLKKLLARRDHKGIYTASDDEEISARRLLQRPGHLTRPARNSTNVNGQRKRYFEESEEEDACGALPVRKPGRGRKPNGGTSTSIPPITASLSRDHLESRWHKARGRRPAASTPTPDSADEDEDEDERPPIDRGAHKKIVKRNFFANKPLKTAVPLKRVPLSGVELDKLVEFSAGRLGLGMGASVVAEWQQQQRQWQ